jgi:erythromycin esterase-like protein
MGGKLRERLDDAYYAVGFLFGTGEFAALARTDATSYAFRTYTLSDPPAGSFEAPFVTAQIPTSFVDLRAAPADPRITRWLDDAHGQRWFGGYGIPDDFEEASRDLSRLQRTVPRKDFDGLVFLSRTTASRVRSPK